MHIAKHFPLTPSLSPWGRGCWCDEERAPYSTKVEQVRPLTEAQNARSWCDEERAPYTTKVEKVKPLTEAR